MGMPDVGEVVVRPYNIALVRLSAIGDCCLVLPVVRAILAHKPNAHIYWLISPPAYALLQYCSHPRLTFKVIDKPKKLVDYWSVRQYFADKHIDVVLAMQASTRANLLYPMLNAPIKIGFDKQRAREGQWLFCNQRIGFNKEHLHESFARFAAKLGVPMEGMDFSIVLGEQDVEKFNLPSSYVVLNPAASKKERTPQASFYIALANWIGEHLHKTVVLTGSNAAFEQGLAQEIAAQTEAQCLNLVGKTSLPQLAIILSQAQCLIAPDTGTAHIGNGVGIPVIGLYAVAPGWLSRPYHNAHLLVDKFPQAVQKFLHKEVASVPWRTRVHKREAMDLIELDEVVQKLQGLFVD